MMTITVRQFEEHDGYHVEVWIGVRRLEMHMFVGRGTSIHDALVKAIDSTGRVHRARRGHESARYEVAAALRRHKARVKPAA